MDRLHRQRFCLSWNRAIRLILLWCSLFVKLVEIAYAAPTYLGKNVSEAVAKSFERCLSFGSQGWVRIGGGRGARKLLG